MAKADALQRKNLTGFTFQLDERRTYPQGTVAAAVLGAMGTDGPLGGLEIELNSTLAGPRRARTSSSATRSARS